MTECISDANSAIPFVVMLFVSMENDSLETTLNQCIFLDYILITEMQRSSYLSEAVPHQQYFIIIHAIAISVKQNIYDQYKVWQRLFSGL